MARRNGVWYEGRLINSNGQCKVSKSKGGRRVLQLLVAEDFREKNKNAPDDKKDPSKGPEDYVSVATAWHQLQVFDSEEGNAAFEALIRDANFNHGAVVVVDASYKEDAKPWKDKQDQIRVGRRESIFMDPKVEDGGSIGYKDIDGKGKTFGATASDANGKDWRFPLWDGSSELPLLGGAGGGSIPAPQYGADEGF